MTINFPKQFLVICLLAVSSCAYADDDKEKKLVNLLDISGVSMTIQNHEKQTLQDLAKEHIINPEGALDRYEIRLFMQKLTFKSLFNQVTKMMLTELNESDIDNLLNLYNMDLMRKLMDAERKLVTADGAKDSAQFMQALPDRIPGKKRINLLIDVVDASLAIDYLIYTSTAITNEKLRAGLEYKNAFNEEQEQRVRFQVAQIKNAMEKNITNQLRVNALYLYREFTDQQLTELLGLLLNKQRIKFIAVFTEAITNSLANGVNQGIKSVLSYRDSPKV